MTNRDAATARATKAKAVVSLLTALVTFAGTFITVVYKPEVVTAFGRALNVNVDSPAMSQELEDTRRALNDQTAENTRLRNDNERLRNATARLQTQIQQLQAQIAEFAPGKKPDPAPVAADCVSSPPPPAVTIPWTMTAKDKSSRLDQCFAFRCPPGGTIRTIYGTDRYTADSSICTAAVHAGAIESAATGGEVTIKIIGPSTYTESFQHNVQSRRARPDFWSGFYFVKKR